MFHNPDLKALNSLRGRTIFLATRNINKFEEARRVLANYNIATAMLKLETLEIQSNNLEEIAKFRAIDAVKKSNLPIIVEDAGLFVRALNGFPGPYSSYVYQTIGKEGILKLLEKVRDRRAYFKSVVAFSEPGKTVKIFSGIVEGVIVEEPKGSSGFGFDPIFKPLNGDGRTFAEMSVEEKSSLSHRSQALRNFAKWYKTLSES
ncbi:TPA: XTP/dITP diphosphatase [Candidatus Bathyarchaeota archaeon]|nr:XTP/dITP diphosphatase [Candidatus Bathyarchaeota archaeon]